MFQLDDKFLSDVGLADLPADQKQAFLQHIYSELELRVGTKLSEGMSEDQLAQFEAFVDQDEQKVTSWFERYLPNYQELPDFQSLKASAPADISQTVLLSEYGSLKWLELNRPDYKQVVASELDKLKSEILQNRDSILGSGTQAA
ncbi:TPA: hypothetical protein DCF80_01970 [Candidatus Saccharibacteria bacterium]|nr:hypothetical protein [Candidatus Saccharibacteria bacterium]HRK41309.1 DUF5663 domain-containing protein [Candidatus Saccharibacteria bacterium]